MRIWRVVHQRYQALPFDAPRANHRWTTTRSHVSYACTTAALAVVEKLALVRRLDQMAQFVLAEAEYEGTTSSMHEPPPGWNRFPHDGAAQSVGDGWVAAGKTGALVVPSALVPGDNIILNQEHPDFQHVRLVEIHNLDALQHTVR